MQVILTTFSEKRFNFAIGLDLPIQKVLILSKTPEKWLPWWKLIAFGGVQLGIHGHEIPDLIVHDKRPRDKMINLIALVINRFFPKNISNRTTPEDGIPESAHTGKPTHALIRQL